jgi:hypothetical protein
MMHTDLIIDGDGQRTQVSPDLRDYVLRYSACDYDCYHQGRYIGSRATLAKATEAVEFEQAKAARHRRLSPATDSPIAAYHDELHAIAARLHDIANRLASHPAEQAPMCAQLTMAHIRISTALRSIQDAERSLRLAEQTVAPNSISLAVLNPPYLVTNGGRMELQVFRQMCDAVMPHGVIACIIPARCNASDHYHPQGQRGIGRAGVRAQRLSPRSALGCCHHIYPRRHHHPSAADAADWQGAPGCRGSEWSIGWANYQRAERPAGRTAHQYGQAGDCRLNRDRRTRTRRGC